MSEEKRDSLTSHTTSAGLFLLRLHAGASMASGGYDKVPTPTWFVEQVADLGWPAPEFFANCAGISEYVGGILLVLGLLTRPAAFFLTITMGVAAFQLQEIRSIETINVAQLYFWVYLMFVFTGAGNWSLDRWLRRPASPNEAHVPTGKNWPWRFILATTIGVAAIGIARMTSVAPETTTDNNEIVSVSVAGNFNEWDVAANPLLETAPRVWETEIDFDAETPILLKFVGNGSWDSSGGEEDEPVQKFPVKGTLEMGDSAKNISTYIPGAGRYRFQIRLDDLAYTIQAVTPTN